MPISVRFDARKGSRSEVLQDALGAFLENSASLLETLQWKAMEQKTERNKNRERSPEIGSAALRPLHARSLSSSSFSPFYSSKRGRSEFNSPPTKSNRFDPRMYLLLPYMLLCARVCEEPVPAPWCFNSSRGRFSSRHRLPNCA